MVGRLLSVVTLAVLIWACGGSASGEPTPPPPATTTVETVGIIAEESARDGHRSFVLADGREVSYDEGVVRIPFHSGGGARLLVAGTDPTGLWLVVAGKQDGMPADCNVINRTGLEWGTGVALFGLLWPKSEGFVSDIALPPFGAPTRMEHGSAWTTPGGSNEWLDREGAHRNIEASHAFYVAWSVRPS